MLLKDRMKDCLMSEEDYKPVELIGGVFRKQGVNLVYGESGLGKTICSIKALNEEGITPILVDFDSNDKPEANSCLYHHVHGYRAVDKKESLELPEEVVIIIDTWILVSGYIGNEEETMQWIEFLQNDGKNTIILIAHNKDIATKKDIPDMDERIVNHLSSKLYLHWTEGKKATSKFPAIPARIDLSVKKLRGYKGNRTIENWMRPNGLNG